MDTKHRHELEQNDLAHFFANFSAFWAKHGNKVLTVALIVLAVFVVKRWVDQSRAGRLENSWADLASSSSPEGFADTALRHQGTPVEALAYLNAGDLLLRKAALPEASAATAPATQSADDRDRSLDEARRMYEKAQAASAATELVKLNAMLGLASVAEARGEVDEARQVYQQVIDKAESFHSIRAQAEARLAIVGSLGEAVVFGSEEPRPPQLPEREAPRYFELDSPSPASRPATQPK